MPVVELAVNPGRSGESGEFDGSGEPRLGHLYQTRMPSDQSTWIISVPQDGDADGLLEELGSKLLQQSKTFSSSNIGQLSIPSFKVYLLIVFLPLLLTR